MNHGRLISRFRVSAAMRPYVLRLRLSGLNFDFGSDTNEAVAYTGCIKRMTGIFARRRVSVAAANKAILATLEAAAQNRRRRGSPSAALGSYDRHASPSSGQCAIARRPASVILTRATSILRPPARTISGANDT